MYHITKHQKRTHCFLFLDTISYKDLDVDFPKIFQFRMLWLKTPAVYIDNYLLLIYTDFPNAIPEVQHGATGRRLCSLCCPFLSACYAALRHRASSWRRTAPLKQPCQQSYWLWLSELGLQTAWISVPLVVLVEERLLHFPVLKQPPLSQPVTSTLSSTNK